MDQPDRESDDERDEPQDDHLDVTAQYGGGHQWETTPTGLRAWWSRFRARHQ